MQIDLVYVCSGIRAIYKLETKMSARIYLKKIFLSSFFFLFLLVYTQIYYSVQLVRIRNIVVALTELLRRRNIDDCRHTYSTWQCLLVSTVQPTPQCLYHTFTSKTPCTLYYYKSKSRYI